MTGVLAILGKASGLACFGLERARYAFAARLYVHLFRLNMFLVLRNRAAQLCCRDVGVLVGLLSFVKSLCRKVDGSLDIPYMAIVSVSQDHSLAIETLSKTRQFPLVTVLPSFSGIYCCAVAVPSRPVSL